MQIDLHSMDWLRLEAVYMNWKRLPKGYVVMLMLARTATLAVLAIFANYAFLSPFLGIDIA